MAGRKYEAYVHMGKPWYTTVAKILFSQIGLFIMCSAYALGGAWLYILLELPHEEHRRKLKLEKTKEVDAAIVYLTKLFWQYGTNVERYNFTSTQFKDQVHQDLETLKNFVIQYNDEYKYDMTDTWTYDWTFPKALLFTVTIMTTIGYGHIYPTTFGGKLFTIPYSLFGIALLLFFMKDIGDSMAVGVRYIYSRICCRWCRVRRRDAELPLQADRKSRSIMHDEVGREAYMPTDQVLVPVMICLIIIFLFLFGGALMFSNWEGWKLGPALYFCFITLTTIGFGDMIPDKAFLGATEGIMGAIKMGITIIYCIFGMMLISLALNLMQEQVMEKIRWFAKQIGLDNDDNTNEEVVKITKENRLKETPSDMTGNEIDFNTRRAKKYIKNEEEGRINEEALLESIEDCSVDDFDGLEVDIKMIDEI